MYTTPRRTIGEDSVRLGSWRFQIRLPSSALSAAILPDSEEKNTRPFQYAGDEAASVPIRFLHLMLPLVVPTEYAEPLFRMKKSASFPMTGGNSIRVLPANS